jgi:hypothetical protein
LTFWNFEDKIHLHSDLFKDFSALKTLDDTGKAYTKHFVYRSQPARTDRLMFAAGPLVSATTTEMR